MRFFLFAASLTLTSCFGRRVPPPSVLHLGGSTDHDTSALLLWIATLSILGIGAAIAAAIFLPIKKLATAIGAGFAATLVLSITLKAALPYMPWVALFVGLCAVGCALWYFRQWVRATHAAVQFGCDMTVAESQEACEIVKLTNSTAQDKLGVKSIIDSVLTKVRA